MITLVLLIIAGVTIAICGASIITKIFALFFTIAGLKADKVNEFVLEAIYNDLADTQPIGRFEMPLEYNSNPGSRIMYTLRSFSVVLLSFARRKAINKIIPEITTGRKGNLATRNFLLCYLFTNNFIFINLLFNFWRRIWFRMG